jgi:hypothetical protein
MPPEPKGGEDLVRAEFVAWLERHMSDLPSVLGQESELRSTSVCAAMKSLQEVV